MALTKLNISNRAIKKRALEPEDIRQSFLRFAREQWGERCPFTVKSVKAGTIRVIAPSAPWRSELVWAREELIEKINETLGVEAIKKIIVWWE